MQRTTAVNVPFPFFFLTDLFLEKLRAPFRQMILLNLTVRRVEIRMECAHAGELNLNSYFTSNRENFGVRV